MKKTLFILILTTVFASCIRFYHLSSQPLGITWDEAALGYNAYSLLLTGKDEHSQIMPVVFKSFGDYKPGLYIYLAVLPVKLLGLNVTSTRIPSALIGILSVIVIFIFSSLLFKKIKIGLFSAFSLAVMPWAIHFSRGAWETNINTFLTLLASTLFIRRKYLLSAVFFGLTFWTYQSAKMFTPLLLLSLIFIFRKSLNKFSIIKIFTVLAIFSLPILINFSEQSGRLKVFSVFSYSRSSESISQLSQQDGLPSNSSIFRLLHSEIADQSRGILQRYLNYLSPKFLFKTGDWMNPRHSTPFYGNLHLTDILLLVLAIIFCIRRSNSGSKTVFLWTIFCILPAALSRDLVSGVRSFSLTVPVAILVGIGLYSLSRSKILFASYGVIFSLFMSYFIDLYFVHYSYYFSDQWLTPYKQIVSDISSQQSNYKKIVISNVLGQPYIFLLFYNQTDPNFYQSHHTFVADANGDVGSVTNFDKYEFRPVYWPADRGSVSTLFAGDIFELPEADLQSTSNIHRISEIRNIDGSIAFHLVGLP